MFETYRTSPWRTKKAFAKIMCIIGKFFSTSGNDQVKAVGKYYANVGPVRPACVFIATMLHAIFN